jgi:hypothetical protein
MRNDYLTDAKKLFGYYKSLGEKAMAQVSDDQLNWKPDPESNSIALIVKHMSGNMMSRWTDFLTTDGEKEWRHRDQEFEGEIPARTQLMERWGRGWKCLFDALELLTEADLQKTVLIRREPHSVMMAINRQLGHYACHVGQIMYVAKSLKSAQWQSLSVPRGGSAAFNAQKSAAKP